MGMCRFKGLVAAAVLAFTPVIAFAEQKTADNPGIFQSIRLNDAMVQYPAPSWVSGGDPRAQSEFYRNQKDNVFILEQIPKGEDFEHWTALYAIMATYEPKYSFKQFVDGSVAVFAQKCGRDHFNVEVMNQNDTTVLLAIMCGSYTNAHSEFGYSPDVGDITAMRLDKVHDSFIKTYHHWRGDKFDLKDQNGWPVSRDTLITMLKRLGAMRIAYDPAGVTKKQPQ